MVTQKKYDMLKAMLIKQRKKNRLSEQKTRRKQLKQYNAGQQDYWQSGEDTREEVMAEPQMSTKEFVNEITQQLEDNFGIDIQTKILSIFNTAAAKIKKSRGLWQHDAYALVSTIGEDPGTYPESADQQFKGVPGYKELISAMKQAVYQD